MANTYCTQGAGLSRTFWRYLNSKLSSYVFGCLEFDSLSSSEGHTQLDFFNKSRNFEKLNASFLLEIKMIFIEIDEVIV